MRIQNTLLALLIAGAFPFSANAAVVCILNADTVEADKASDRKESPGCDTKTLRNSLPAMRDAINTAGTKMVSTSTLTNTDKLAIPQEQQGIADGAKAAPEKAVPAVPALVPVLTWEVLETDVRLSNTFERWAKTAGIKVRWDAEKHVLIDGTPRYAGTIEDAIAAALSTPAILYGPYPLEACVYPNDPPLVRITRQGEQIKECPNQ